MVAKGNKKDIYMRALLVLCLLLTISTSCQKNRTRVDDYYEQMELIKIHFPEMYNLYRHGHIIIEAVHISSEDNGKEVVHLSYRYR